MSNKTHATNPRENVDHLMRQAAAQQQAQERETAKAIEKIINATPHMEPKNCPFDPFGKRVVCALHERKRSEGGILLPQQIVNEHYEASTATVVAVGQECATVKVGDHIMCRADTVGTILFYKGYKCFLIEESVIVGRMRVPVDLTSPEYFDPEEEVGS